jgi:sulfonate transport system ATP-binding protein
MNLSILALALDLPTVYPEFEPMPAYEPVYNSGVSVEFHRLEKSFGERRVMAGVDLAIEAGEFIAIVGRSGCGKSTLLRLLAGLDTPTAGTIELSGGATPARDVRLMFQEARLLPWTRVLPNVEVGLAGTRDEQHRHCRLAREALARVGLADRTDDWPAALSGGQKQRVALARALVSRPAVLALAEPLGALDALTRIQMQTLIEENWLRQGFTALLVTHDVAEAVTLADRVLILEEGRITREVLIELPRPRRHGDAGFAAIEQRILDCLLER